MAPKSPLSVNKKPALNSGIATPATTSSKYDEAQDDEMAVLEAIYMDDYTALDVQHAWNKTTDRSFQIRLRAFTDTDTNVVLSVKLTATYPRTVPLLNLSDPNNFHDRTQRRIQNVVQVRPRKLLGDVMIHAICEEIQDALEDAVLSRQKGTLPSLEEERASAEEVATTLAKQAEEVEARQQKEVQDEADRVLQRMVDEEINRREKRKPPKSSAEHMKPTHSTADVVSFDKPIDLSTDDGVEIFTDVLIVGQISRGEDPVERSFLGRPQNTLEPNPPFVVIKRRKLKKDRTDVIALEAILDTAQRLRHPSLLTLLAYRIKKIDDTFSELIVCQEYSEGNTLQDLLTLGSIHSSKAKQWAIELLEGLDFIHRNGMVHGSLNTHSVILTGRPAHSLKMVDFGFKEFGGRHDEGLGPKWSVPDEGSSLPSQRKADIWNIGVIMTQMFLGLQVVLEYPSPSSLVSRPDLAEPFTDLLHKAFALDTKKQTSAFDLLPAEFLRTTSPVFESSSLHPPRNEFNPGISSPLRSRRSRHDSSTTHDVTSRYMSDFTELGRLGRGGFGEVVKARNKLDGGVYAVKKIRQAPQLLDQVLSEVMLLNRLNHPYVVRYFSTWVESDTSYAISEDTVSATDETLSNDHRIDFGYPSTGGLDFVSSSGLHGVEFDDDSDDSELEQDDSQTGGSDIFERDSADADNDDASPTGGSSMRLKRTRSDSRRLPSTMYIQMEYCERRTLRDLIHKGMDEDDSWRYIRQITEGLAHVHSHGIIHRDLKPDNVFLDVALSPKIGDFGLATTGQHQASEKPSGSKTLSVDMTRSVGTALYTAPELRSTSGTSYNDKVDMYSLGIIFFEMNMPFGTAMERINELQLIRAKSHDLPASFRATGEKAAQGRLISCLISHKPSERPSSTELLRSEILPLKIEDETIRQALTGLSDPRSPYHQKMMSALFAHDPGGSQHVKALAWQAKAPINGEDPERLRIKNVIRSSLVTVFRRHGAEETRRDTIFPRSVIYSNPNVMQMLDAAGNLLQLPYDLTLPNARQLARQPSSLRCTYAFGCAYRDAFSGGPPKVNEEADFDIVSADRDNNKAIDDAEILKVLDEVALGLPTIGSPTSISININHCKILDAILEYCRVPQAQHHVVREELSKLGFYQWTWTKLRPDLKSMGLSDTTLDDLQLFDFRDTPDKAFLRLQHLFESVENRTRSKFDEGKKHLTEILSLSEGFAMKIKMFVAPLSCFNAKFYEGGILFQCVMDRKTNRIALAAGGRYDSLIQKFRPVEVRPGAQCAVGLCIGIEQIVSQIAKNTTKGTKASFMKHPTQISRLAKRCDVLVVAGVESRTMQNAGIRLVSTLWAHDINAELSVGTVLEKDYSFVVTLRHAASNSVKVTNIEGDGGDVDVPISSLVNHIQQDLRERAGNKGRAPLLRSHSSHHEGKPSQNNNVQVLLARHGSKKSNKYHIVEVAQQRWAEKLDVIKQSAPILAVETRDEVVDLIQQTLLGEPESWRKAVQSVHLNERQYIQQIQEVLDGWRKTWSGGDGIREACVFNFRTGKTIHYDLGL